MASYEVANLEPEQILIAVSQLGVCGDKPSVDGEFGGGECHIFKVTFTNQDSIAVRVRLATGDSSHEGTVAAVEAEVRILQALEAKGFPWAPKYRGASLTFDNPVKRPFIVLTWAEGSILEWDENFPPQPHRDALLGQIASMQLCLIQSTLEEGSVTATAFFERRLANRRARVREGKIPELSDQDCLDQQALLDRVLGQDANTTLFAIDHGDIKPGNIIVDQKYNIQCIIDWGFAQLVPLPKAAVLPRFLWPDEPVHLAPSLTLRKDRQAYIRSLASQHSLVSCFMLRWLSAEDVDFRTLYLESIFSKGIHISLVRVGWKLPYCKVECDENRISEPGGCV